MTIKLIQTILITLIATLTLNAEVASSEQNLTGNAGVSISMSGEWAAVGAYDPLDSSSCYVTIYQLDYTTMIWNEHSTLGGNGNCNANKGFGAAISLSGSEMVIGLANYKNNGAFSAYQYNNTMDSWNLVLGPVEATDESGVDDTQANSGFGTALNIQEGILLIGAPQYDGANGTDAGKVYLYERPPGTFTTLLPTVTVEGDQGGSLFGSAVAGDAIHILVGASGYDQGGLTDNGAGFMYEYNSSVPSLTLTGELYGTADNEALGVQIDHKEPYALISGNLRTYGYHYDGTTWHRDLTQESTGAGDVSISDSVSAVATKGSSVDIYPSIHSSHNSYSLTIAPAGVGSEYGEDISLSQNLLLVSEADSNQVRMYEMPCGYGGDLKAYEWKMVSVPCGDGAANIGDIFVDDLGTYGNSANWVMYEQNASTDYNGTFATMREMLVTDAMVLGRGYWIIADANRTWKADDNVISLRTSGDILNDGLGSIPNDTIKKFYEFSLPLSTTVEQKVMVGNPYPRTFQWENVYFLNGTTGQVGQIDDATYATPYIRPNAYVYDTTQAATGQPYRSITVNTPGTSGEIAPNQGFWIMLEANRIGSNDLIIPFEK